MNYFKKLIIRVSRKNPLPPANPTVATKLNYTAEVAHLNTANIKCGEIEETEFDTAMVSYLGSKKKIEQAFYRQFVLFDETVHKRPLIYPVAFGGGGGARE